MHASPGSGTCHAKPPVCRVYAPRPPLAGKKGRKAGAVGGCAEGLKDFFIPHKVLCKRPLATNGEGAPTPSVCSVRFECLHRLQPTPSGCLAR